LLGGLLFVVIWASLLTIIPEGWWLAVFQVVCFLISIVLIGYGSMQCLRLMGIRTAVSFVTGLTIWFLLAVMLRSFLLTLLGVI